MKKYLSPIFITSMTLGAAQVATANDDFYGTIESRPEGKVGTWVIGGRSVEVTKSTELDDDNGPLTIGACVEVDIDDGKVDEIESEPAEKCNRNK